MVVGCCGRSDGWICETFSCVLVTFRSTLVTARVHLTVRLNTKGFESMLGRRDIIVFETNAHVVIKQPNYITQPDNDMIMVGAPRRNRSEVPDTREPGQAMMCPLHAACSPMPRSHVRDPMEDLYGGILGAAVDIHGDRYVVGCPGRKDLRYLYTEIQYTMLGAFYLGGASSTHRDNPAYKYLPLNNPDLFSLVNKNSNNRTIRYPIYMFGEAGFSAHFPNIAEKQKQLMLGAPGAYNWAGSAILYHIEDFNMGGARRRRSIGPGVFTSEPFIINAFRKPSLDKYGLFGYAVTSGRFFSRQDVFYVGGAPRAESYGHVYLFKFSRVRGSKDPMAAIMTNKITLSGTQPGEYFGSSLAACDVNGDNLDDLLVGAPLYTHHEQDEGRVLVYLGNQQQFSSQPNQELKGTAPNGRFGYSIACLGDMDQDKYQDVAIGAPFEDNGVVYLYNGGPRGLSAVTRRIAASEHFPNLSGFGFSLSRGQDVDGNSYPDVAVGAFRSGHALLLRSRPVVQFKVKLKAVLQGLRRDADHVELEICVKYFGTALPIQLRVIQRLRLDPTWRRAFLNETVTAPEIETERELSASTELDDNFNCDEIKVHLKSNIDNFLEPLTFEIEYDLPKEDPSSHPLNFFEGRPADEENDESWTMQPVLRPGASNVASAKAFFETECRGTDNICNSELSVSVQFLDTSDKPFLVGSLPSLQLQVTVVNAAGSDPAYNARLEVILSVPVLLFPPACQFVANTTSQATVLSCIVGNPLNPNSQRDFLIALNMVGVSASSGSLQVKARVTTASEDATLEDNEAEERLPLFARADLTISGKSAQEMYSYVDLENEGQRIKTVPFILQYQIEKFDVSPVQEVKFSIFYPSAAKEAPDVDIVQESENQKYELSLNSGRLSSCSLLSATSVPPSVTSQRDTSGLPTNRTFYVNCSSGEWLCKELRCSAGPFVDSLAAAYLQIFLQLDITAIEPKLGRKDKIIFSTAAVITGMDKSIMQPQNQKPDEAVVAAVFSGNLPEGRVAAWVLIVSVLAGILLLAALVAALVKAGFFKRKDKEALSLMKKENTEGTTNPQGVVDEK